MTYDFLSSVKLLLLFTLTPYLVINEAYKVLRGFSASISTGIARAHLRAVLLFLNKF